MSRNARTSAAATNADLSAPGYPGQKGLVTAGTSSTVTIAGALAVTDVYNTAYIKVVAAADGSEQVRVITDYTAGGVATVTPDFATTPVNGDSYLVYGFSGKAQAGASGSVTLAAAASAVDGAYVGALIKINAGVGLGQVTRITAYNGTTKVAAVIPVWDTSAVPDNTSYYTIYGEGGTGTMQSTNSISAPGILLAASDYAGMYVDILTCPDNIRAIGQVSRIAGVVGTIISLVAKLPQQPVGSFTYRIIPGWSSGYSSVEDATFVMTQFIARRGQTGVRENYSSITATGSNSAGENTSHREMAQWGSRLDVDDPGVVVETNPVCGQFYRLDYTCFSAGINGGVSTRFSDSSQVASAGSEASTTSSTIGSAGAGGGEVSGEIPALGQASMANSLPVVIASNQTAVPVTGTFNVDGSEVEVTNTVDVAGTGVAGTAAGGVLTVQGDAAATPIPVTGTFNVDGSEVEVTNTVATAGTGIAGTPAGGVLTVQGDAAATPVPVTGTFNVDGSEVEVTNTVATAGTGTAGTPAGGVLTVQGVASGTALEVSATALPLPSGAATAAKQPALGTAGTAASDVISVQGIASGTALEVAASSDLPISATALPLPSGAATAAKQPALGTAGTAASDVISVQGIASGTALEVASSAELRLGAECLKLR
jgi:hypothetical protein